MELWEVAPQREAATEVIRIMASKEIMGVGFTLSAPQDETTCSNTSSHPDGLPQHDCQPWPYTFRTTSLNQTFLFGTNCFRDFLAVMES